MDITAVIKLYVTKGILPCFRGEEELLFLRQWIGRGVSPATGGTADEADIHELIAGCEKCGKGLEKKFGSGIGKNRVMVVLNSPRLMRREDRDKYGKDSMDLMKKIIGSVKLDFEECYITDLIKCEAADNLIKPSLMFEACREILLREIVEYNPVIVLVMGDILPLQKLINEHSSITWYNIHHPITLLLNSELKKPAWNTMKLIMKQLEELKSDSP